VPSVDLQIDPSADAGGQAEARAEMLLLALLRELRDVATRPRPIAVRAEEAAELFGVSRATWFRLHAAGLVPKPIELGGAVRWSVRELEEWTDAGCPPRERWESIRGARRR